MTEQGFNRGKVRQELPAPHAERQTQQPENRNRDDAHFPCAQADSHDQRQRNCNRYGENPPRTLRQGLDHHQRENGQQDNHNGQHADESEQAHATPDFVLHHLAERFPAAPDRGKQNNHIVHSSAERRTDQNPECAREEPKLRCQHRTD